MKTFIKQNLDYVGICVSSICAVHCLIVPILLLFISTVGIPFIENHLFDYLVFGLSMLIASISLVYSYVKKHKKLLPLGIAGLGFLSIFTGWALGYETSKVILSVMGGILIAISHYKNLKTCKTK